MILIDYKIVGPGWAECFVGDGHISVRITASYLSDALGSLLSAVIELINGKTKVYARFDEEPGEYRWVFERVREDRVTLMIIEFPSLLGGEPDENGKKLFESEDSLNNIVSSVFHASDNVLKNHGEHNYHELWIQHAFPRAQYDTLGSWLLAK